MAAKTYFRFRFRGHKQPELTAEVEIGAPTYDDAWDAARAEASNISREHGTPFVIVGVTQLQKRK